MFFHYVFHYVFHYGLHHVFHNVFHHVFHPTGPSQKFHPLLSLSDSGQADCPYGTPGHIHLGIGGVLAQSQLVSSYGWPA